MVSITGVKKQNLDFIKILRHLVILIQLRKLFLLNPETGCGKTGLSRTIQGSVEGNK